MLSVAIGLTTSSAQAHEETEIIVGHTAAGQFHVGLDFPQPIELDPSIFAGINGYATGELAFHSTILDDTNSDSFQLSTESDFRFILLAKDPGMELTVFNGTNFVFMNVGESYYIGVSPFDTHPIWNLVNGTPGNVYSMTLKLRDLNGIYPDSEPFVLSFTPAPIYGLQIKSASAGQATLSWSTNAVDWALESADTLAATNWTTITNTPTVSGTNYTFDINTTEAQRFYRLQKF